MNIEAIAIDLDGTLLNSKTEISEFNKKIINKVKDMGIKIIIATGRSYTSLYKYKQELNLDEVLISYNGAKAVDGKTDETIFEIPIEEEYTKKIIEIARMTDTQLNLFQDEIWYSEKMREEVEKYQNTSGLNYVIKNFDEFKNYSMTKAMYIGEPEKLKEIEIKISEILDNKIHKTYSKPFYLEILNKKVSKGDSLIKLLEKLNINPKNVMAFGDQANDYEMLSQVGLGVVMGNAREDLKSKIKNITLSNDEDGVGKFIEKFFNL